MRSFLLRLPAELHARLKQDAAVAGMSMNEYCVAKLASPTELLDHHRGLIQNRNLAVDHLKRASARLGALDVLYIKSSWADVVRESQEVVELALKGLLRSRGVDPPHIPDVADAMIAQRHRLPDGLKPRLDELTGASRALRRDRDLAFYGTDDLTPSDFYREADARQARDLARQVVAAVAPHVLPS